MAEAWLHCPAVSEPRHGDAGAPGSPAEVKGQVNWREGQTRSIHNGAVIGISRQFNTISRHNRYDIGKSRQFNNNNILFIPMDGKLSVLSIQLPPRITRACDFTSNPVA